MRFTAKSLLGAGVVLLAAAGCGQPDPGQVRLLVSGPADETLSPLKDPRLSALELRDARTGEVLGSAQVQGALQPSATLALPDLPVGAQRDLQLLAKGAAGQVLGLAVQNSVDLSYGQSKDVVLSLRRPLFFFGGGPTLLPAIPTKPDELGLRYAMQQQLATELREDPVALTPWQWKARLTTVDPNAGLPLLPKFDSGKPVPRYTRALPLPTPVITSAGSNDGLSLLALTPGNPPQLHIIDTNGLTLQASYPVPMTMTTPRAIVVEPQDRWAALLYYDLPAPTVGRVGSVVLLRNLKALRARSTTTVDAVTIDLSSTMQSPLGVPLSAAVTPDGQLDVVFGQSPLEANQPDCTKLSMGTPSVLRRYDPQSGAQKDQRSLPYTSTISYTQAGDRVLVQPCALYDAMKPLDRLGVVQIDRVGEGGTLRLWAPGTLAVAPVGQPAALVAVGRDNTQPSQDAQNAALGAVRVLEPGRTDWSTTSTFALPNWTIPYVVTTKKDMTPLPDVVNIQLAARDMSAYQVVVTPDRARALAAARISYNSVDVFVDTTPAGNYCLVSWSGYGYAVMLLNLQTGAREQLWTLGLQNIKCDSRSVTSGGTQTGTGCFGDCDSSLRGYQDGYAPSGISAIFGGR